MDIVSYLFLKNQFAFFDFEQTAVSVFLEYIAMMGLWIFAGYYFMKGVSRLLYSGDSGLPGDIAKWLEKNSIKK